MPPDPFGDYLKSIRRDLSATDATEHTHRPALKALIEALDPHVQAVNEPRHRTDCGAPDYRVRRGQLTLGYVECKDIGVSLDEAERSEQVQRYLKHLSNLVLTDYLEFRWYVDGDLRQRATVAHLAHDGKLTRDGAGAEAARELLASFLAHAPERIDKPRDLAVHMARLTHAIHDIIIETFKQDRASNTLAGLHQAFQKTLIPDLAVEQFADMFAQTLAYGLFAARCNHKGPEPFRRLGAAAEIPKTNPFLRHLFDTMTGLALDDEPFVGFVDDLVELLANVDMGAILRDFGKRTRKQDPIVHFYETFLIAYNPKDRKLRGVYYTPEPVISYIVRSVDHLLKTRFRLPDGLADRATVEYEREERQGDKITKVKATSPRVLILDPACGTGGFLYAIVDHIRDEFTRRGDAGMWSGYVKEHLLPRLFGFELLMAPYAVAHFKLGMQLAAQDMPEAQREQWAYDFSGNERLGIYLTNTLEQAERQAETLFGPLRIITEEANAAARIKRDLPIMVVLGNPPYAGHSANRSWEIREGKKVPTFIGRLLQDYYRVDGQPLGERNPKWLQDDYVKFIRFGQWRIEQTGAGILAFITNHGYLDNPTFRGMRQQLMNAFTDIYILDLHGNAKKKERCPDGSKDENVFDIMQGVAIGLFVKEPGKSGPAKVHHADLWGLRETPDKQSGKYPWLFAHEVAKTDWAEATPAPTLYIFKPRASYLPAEYAQGLSVADSMRINSVGVVTARDRLTIQWSREEVWRVVQDFARLSEEQARTKYELGADTRDWQVALAQEDARASGPEAHLIVPILYRPFDTRHTYYTGRSRGFQCMPRREVMRHMLVGRNVGIITTRQTRDKWDVLATNLIVGHKSLAAFDINSLFPLYLYQHWGQDARNGPEARLERVSNLHPGFVADIETRLRLRSIADGYGDLKETFGPEDVFHYIYGVLHSPTYRARYAEFLKIDFPRVPLTSKLDLFRALAAKGADLVALHIMEDNYPAASWTVAGRPSPFASPITRFPVPGDNLVDKGCPRYFPPGHRLAQEAEPLAAGRVYIGAEDPKTGKRGQYFEGVPPEVWQFHIGGYQVCEKWLKDRRGRQLSYEDLTHYQRIVVALNETIRLMAEIDAAIPGWPLE